MSKAGVLGFFAIVAGALALAATAKADEKPAVDNKPPPQPQPTGNANTQSTGLNAGDGNADNSGDAQGTELSQDNGDGTTTLYKTTGQGRDTSNGNPGASSEDDTGILDTIAGWWNSI